MVADLLRARREAIESKRQKDARVIERILKAEGIAIRDCRIGTVWRAA